MLMPAITDDNHSTNESELPKDRDNPNNLFYYFLCIISLILAVLSKPVAVVLPFVVIFLDIIFIIDGGSRLELYNGFDEQNPPFIYFPS